MVTMKNNFFKKPYCNKVFALGFFLLIFLPGYSLSETLIYCSEASPDYFNPQMSLSGSAFDASNLLYSRLVEFNPDGTKLVPGLAKKWTISKDKKRYTFYLRKNVLFYPRGDFQASRPFNADDVLFSFQRQKNKSHPFYSVNGGGYKFFHSLDLQNQISEIKKINDHTVQFVLKQPLGLFPNLMAMEFAVILSKEYGDFLLKKKRAEKIDFEPVGTGPFILEKYIKGHLIRYKRNENYYLDPPKLKKIVFSITPDPSVRFQKLKRGECHLDSKPQPINIPLMKKNKKIRVMEGMAYNLAYLAMNTSKAPLNNKKVRKAIAHSLNRKLYIAAIYKGLAETLDSPVPPALWGHNSKVKLPEYNIQKAKTLLKEAGFEKGFSIKLWTLPVSRPYNPNGKKMGELMQSDLKKAGIKVQLVTYDWPTYLAKSSQGEHEMIQMGWSADIADPSNFLQILLTCDSIASGSNLSRWCNKNYDLLISKAMAQFSQKSADLLYKKAQVLFSQALPLIPIAHAYRYVALSPKVKGYRLKPFGSERFYHLSLSHDKK